MMNRWIEALLLVILSPAILLAAFMAVLGVVTFVVYAAIGGAVLADCLWNWLRRREAAKRKLRAEG